MDWTSLIGQMLFCLLIAGLLGGVIGWLLKTLLGGNKLADLEEEWQVRYSGKEHELETLQAKTRDQLREAEARLTDCSSVVKAREAALAEWDGKYAKVRADLDTRAAAQEKLVAEAADWRDKHAQAEAELQSHATAYADLETELGGLRQSFAGKETELADLGQQVASLLPLRTQVEDGAAKLQAALKERDEREAEIKRLQLNLTNQETAHKQALSALSAKATEWENKHLLLAKEHSTAESESKKLRLRLSGELEAVTRKAGEWENQCLSLTEENKKLQLHLKELEASHLQAAEWERKCLQMVKDRDLARSENEQLYLRLSELEVASRKTGQLYQSETQERDQRLAALQLQLQEQEASQQSLIGDWEAKLLALTNTKDADLRRLQMRVSELEPLGAQLANYQIAAREREAQLAALQARVRELEGAPRTTDLIRVEGIGQVYYERLTKLAGVWTQAELLDKGRTALGRKEIAEKAGIDATLILRWVNHVDLRRIEGIDEQYAELLEAAGVDTVPELAQRRPDNLLEKVAAVNGEKRVSPRTPSADDIQSWVEKAKSLPRVVTH